MPGVGGAAVLAVAGCEQEVVERIVEVEVPAEKIVEKTVEVEGMAGEEMAEEAAASGPAAVWRIGIFEDVTTHNFFNILGPGQTAWNFYAFLNRYPSLYGLSDQRFDWVPMLADGFPGPFTEEGDFVTATVTMKQGPVWSDGQPITAEDIASHPAPPSMRHWLGTDPLGRDVMSQLMSSARSEFALGLIAAIVTVVIATTIGAVSAYYGGIVDTVLMRLADLVIMMPTLSLLIVVVVLFDLNLFRLAIILGIIAGFGGAAVVIKSQALTIKVKPYMEAVRVAGGGTFHLLFVHMIPNLLPITFLYMMFTVTGAIFSEAVLSFFGVLNIRMSWGIMIHTTQAAGYLLGG